MRTVDARAVTTTKATTTRERASTRVARAVDAREGDEDGAGREEEGGEDAAARSRRRRNARSEAKTKSLASLERRRANCCRMKMGRTRCGGR